MSDLVGDDLDLHACFTVAWNAADEVVGPFLERELVIACCGCFGGASRCLAASVACCVHWHHVVQTSLVVEHCQIQKEMCEKITTVETQRRDR